LSNGEWVSNYQSTIRAILKIEKATLPHPEAEKSLKETDIRRADFSIAQEQPG